MTVKEAILRIQSYPFYDIDTDTKTIRRNLNTADAKPELISSYLSEHQRITLVPKYKNGNAPMRNEDDMIVLETLKPQSASNHPVAGLNGFDALPVNSQAEGLYKILYEQARAELSDVKKRLDDAISDKHRSEIELVANRNGVGSHLVQGISALAPALAGIFGGGGGAGAIGMGNVEAAPAQQQQVQQAVQDQKLVAIVKHYQTLDEQSKQKIYQLLVSVFSNMDKLDEIISLL